MRRLILPLLLWLAGAGVAHASCPATLTDCPSINADTGAFGGSVAQGGGKAAVLKADGVTSDDAALAAAVADCTAHSGVLYLPPGTILLTGAAQISLSQCSIKGVGQSGAGGTQINLTSTTISPFVAHYNWSLEGINFYWPNQISGTTVYPPLIVDTGAGSGDVYISNITIINGYDGISLINGGSGRYKIVNSTMWVMHNLFTFYSTGDSFEMTGLHLTPGPLFGLCGFSAPCEAAVNAAVHNNTIFDVPPNGSITVAVAATQTEAWRNAIKIEANGIWSNSYVDMELDGTGTIIDASASGANYSAGSVIKGTTAGCFIPQWGGSNINVSPCFNMGASSNLTLNNYIAGGNDIIWTAGSSIAVNGGSYGVGGSSGADGYFIKATAGVGDLWVQNVRVAGSANAFSHGILATTAPPTAMMMTNNRFFNLNDVYTGKSVPYAIVSGNLSDDMYGTGPDFVYTDSANVYATWAGNEFQRPPKPTLSACGTGATVNGGPSSGQITIGSTIPTTACTVTFPVQQYGLCTFMASTNTVLGAPPTNVWNLTFPSDVHGQLVMYNCNPK